jgi:hypothetical protein
MAGKQYEVVRPFRRVDPESGDVTHHEPGDTYSGPMEDEEHYTGKDGPDGKGPLVMAKSDIAAEEKRAAEEAKAAEQAVVEQEKSAQPPTGQGAFTSGNSSKGGK